jgi:Arc/MetJ family transcription regulator
MRTSIDIDDELLAQAMAAAGLPTKRATVEEGLRLLVRLREQAKALVELKGLGWEGDLHEMRRVRRGAGRDPRR